MSRSCTVPCWPGGSEVNSEATEGLVQEAWAMACSNSTASFEKAISSGVVSRA